MLVGAVASDLSRHSAPLCTRRLSSKAASFDLSCAVPGLFRAGGFSHSPGCFDRCVQAPRSCVFCACPGASPGFSRSCSNSAPQIPGNQRLVSLQRGFLGFSRSKESRILNGIDKMPDEEVDGASHDEAPQIPGNQRLVSLQRGFLGFSRSKESRILNGIDKMPDEEVDGASHDEIAFRVRDTFR